MNSALLLLLAVLCGIAVALQGQFMGLMDQQMGTRESMFITYGGGGLLIALVVLLGGGGNLQAWRMVPWYALSTGLLGLVIVGTIGYVVPRLGLATGLTLIVAVQFIVAALIDQFGLFGAAQRPLDGSGLLGLLVVFLGVWLLTR